MSRNHRKLSDVCLNKGAFTPVTWNVVTCSGVFIVRIAYCNVLHVFTYCDFAVSMDGTEFTSPSPPADAALQTSRLTG